jgi:hypothetical protein
MRHLVVNQFALMTSERKWWTVAPAPICEQQIGQMRA